jgi:hypothetical protein
VFAVVPQLLSTRLMNPIPTAFPAAYHLVRLVSYPGIQGTLVATYSRSGSP